MYKKIIFPIFLTITIVTLFINSYMNLEYGMNIIEYYSSETDLTSEELLYLKENSTLIYGADYNSPPLRYVNESSGQYEGLSVDYLRALALDLGVSIDFRPLVWNDALGQLASGQTDICDMYKSEDRSKSFLFSDPIYYQRGVILTTKTSSIKSVQDLESKTISGSNGDYVFEYLEDNFTDIKAVPATDLQEAIALLQSGEVDAVLGDEAVLNYFLVKESMSGSYILLDEYLYELEAVIGVSKDNQVLLSILNKGITNLQKKKTMESVYQKWYGNTPIITKSNKSDKYILIFKYSVLLMSVVGFGLYYWNMQLKKLIAKKTDELIISKDELETTFDGLTHLMVVINKYCVVTDANTAFCQSVNMTKESVKSKHCFGVNGILGTDCSKCILKDTFDKKESLIREINHGGSIYKASTFILKASHTSDKRALIMMEDITSIKATQQQMLQSSKMAAVGQLAAGVAHEIRNPLGIIRNYAYLLKATSQSDEDKDSITIIENSVVRASNIIDNLLNFSRLSDNRTVETNVTTLILDIIELSKKNLEENNITCSLSCEEGLMATLPSESLKHSIINLITNAVDAMPDGGLLSIDAYKKNERIYIRISDNGMGIPKDIIDNIFNPFYTTKDPGSGTGLGLFITYSEIEKMNGTISVNSSLGVGSTFEIIL